MQRLSDEQKKFIENNYPLLGGLECSAILGIDYKRIAKYTTRNKIRVNPDVRKNISKINISKAHSESQKKYNKEIIDFDFSIFTNSAEKCYVLGLIWGDGFLFKKRGNGVFSHNIRLNILEEDFAEIEKMFSKNDWSIYRRQREGRRLQINACCKNKFFSYFLSTNDYKNKSLLSPSKIINLIQEEFIRFFILGLCDADGCFYFNAKGYLRQFSLAGTFDQDWSSIEEVLKSEGIKYKISRITYKSGSRGSLILITNRENINKLIEYLYPNSKFEIGFKRKYLKAMDIIDF